MNHSNLKQEEYTTVAEFLIASLTRDQKELTTRFSKYTPQYIEKFRKLNDKVKELENPGGIVESMKETTANLYGKADELRNELSFITAYYRSAAIEPNGMADLKKNLTTKNIEGAMHGITALKDHINKHRKALVAQGMPENMADTLLQYRDIMNQLNQQQNRFISQRKDLTRKNLDQYEALFEYIRDVVYDGKIFYKNQPRAKDYTLTYLIQQLRAAARNPKDEDNGPGIPGPIA